jgi:hypothetical protein
MFSASGHSGDLPSAAQVARRVFQLAVLDAAGDAEFAARAFRRGLGA